MQSSIVLLLSNLLKSSQDNTTQFLRFLSKRQSYLGSIKKLIILRQDVRILDYTSCLLPPSQVQPVRMVRRPSLQPRLRRGGEQLHPPQQLLVWSRLLDATRYGGCSARHVSNKLCQLCLASAGSHTLPLELTSSMISILRLFHKTFTCQEQLHSSGLHDKGRLLTPTCCLKRKECRCLALVRDCQARMENTATFTSP